MRRKNSFIADQRGAVAFEMLFVFAFMMLSLLLPLADVAIAGFQYVSAWEALRGFGQSIQYNPPPDVTNASSWASTALAKADPNFPIPSIQLICGDSNICLLRSQHCVAQVLFIHDERHLGAHTAKIGVVYEWQCQSLYVHTVLLRTISIGVFHA